MPHSIHMHPFQNWFGSFQFFVVVGPNTIKWSEHFANTNMLNGNTKTPTLYKANDPKRIFSGGENADRFVDAGKRIINTQMAGLINAWCARGAERWRWCMAGISVQSFDHDRQRMKRRWMHTKRHDANESERRENSKRWGSLFSSSTLWMGRRGQKKKKREC